MAEKTRVLEAPELGIGCAHGMARFLESAAGSLRRVIFPLSEYAARAAAFLVFLMGVVTAVDILARYFFNRPVPEVMELAQFLLAMTVFLGIAYTATKNGHVGVDILTAKFPRKVVVFLSSVSSLVSICLFLVMGWQQIEKAVISIRTGELAPVTSLPYFPFLFLIALGCAALALVFVTDFLGLQSEVFKTFRRPRLWAFVILATSATLLLSPVLLQLMTVKMSAFAAGLWGVALLMILIFSGFPIGFVMGLVGLLGCWYVRDLNCSMMTLQMTVFSSVGEYFYTVVPLFVGMGFVCFAADLSKDLYDSFYKVFGGVRGALAMATVASCAGFASICGDSGATGATMGSVAIPEMKKARYKPSLATGCVAAGGTLGILIPPSVGFIVYGMITEQSIGKLFAAGIIPGILLAALFCVAIYIQCTINPAAGPAGPSFSFLERLWAIKGVWPILLLFLLVMGGMYAGVFTATEGGAVGLVAALLIGFFLRRFTWKRLFDAFMETVNVTAMVFTIFIGVSLLNNFMALSELPLDLGNWVKSLEVSRYIVYILVLLIYVFLGCAMNIIPMIMLTLPIIFPLVKGLGFDPIWFGVIMVIMMEMGQITPPVGINVYIITGVAKDVPMGEVFKGTIPFIIMEVVMVIILTLFPDIALLLPHSMGGLAPIGD